MTVAAFYARVMAALAGLASRSRSPPCPTRWSRPSPSRPTPRTPRTTRRRSPGCDRRAADRPGPACVPLAVHGQGQPGALLLGSVRHGGVTVLRSPGAAAPGRCAQLPRLRDARGVLGRGVERGVVARGRRGRRADVLLVRVPPARRLRRAQRATRGRVLRRDAGRVPGPYEAVRTAGDPDAALLAFLQTTYERRPTWPTGTAPPSRLTARPWQGRVVARADGRRDPVP